MEKGGRGSEGIGVGTNFIKGEKGILAVKCGVFKAFGLDRACGLLKAKREAFAEAFFEGVDVWRVGGDQEVVEEVEHQWINGGEPVLRERDGLMDLGSVFDGDFITGADIGAINAEAGDDFDEDAMEVVMGEISGAKPSFAELVEEPGEGVQLAGKE